MQTNGLRILDVINVGIITTIKDGFIGECFFIRYFSRAPEKDGSFQQLYQTTYKYRLLRCPIDNKHKVSLFLSFSLSISISTSISISIWIRDRRRTNPSKAFDALILILLKHRTDLRLVHSCFAHESESRTSLSALRSFCPFHPWILSISHEFVFISDYCKEWGLHLNLLLFTASILSGIWILLSVLPFSLKLESCL